MKYTKGFTVVEILVVITILSALVGVILFNSGNARDQSRDIERQSDLRALQSAIELYKQRYGRYPAGCRGPGTWSGEIGTVYECPTGAGQSQYIRGHEAGINFAPDFIRTLPTDPRRVDAQSGYVYATNAEGTVYKLMARRTVEAEVVDEDHLFASCELGNAGAAINGCESSYSPPYYGNKPGHCNENHPTFRTTYAVWGGYPFEPNTTPISRADEERDKIICNIP